MRWQLWTCSDWRQNGLVMRNATECRKCGEPIVPSPRRYLCDGCLADFKDGHDEERKREARRGGSSTLHRGGDAPEGLDPDDMTRLAEDGWPYDDEDEEEWR